MKEIVLAVDIKIEVSLRANSDTSVSHGCLTKITCFLPKR
jgi:hypothetical protein